MKLEAVKINTKKITLVLSFVLCAAVGFGVLKNLTVNAEPQKKSVKSFSVSGSNDSAVNIEENRSPWIKMRQGKTINSELVGTETAIGQFESNSLSPTTLVSADFNYDGYPDVISGFAGANGGVLTFHKGWNQAFAPDTEEVLAGIKRGEFPVSFEKEAKVLEVPISPDFIVTGKFVTGSALDLIVGSRQSRSLYLLTSDEKGGFNAPQEIPLSGEATALAADNLSVSNAYTGLVVATKNESGFEALIFNGSESLNPSSPQRMTLSKETTSLVLTSPDGLTTDKDLFLLGGGELSRISGIGKTVSSPAPIDLPFPVSDFAAGEFIRDRLAKVEIAVLSENGTVYYLTNGALDTRPFTESEMRKNFAKYGRGRKVVVNSNDSESALANNWTIAEQQNLGIFNFTKQNSQSLLRKSYITGNETEDLLVVNPAENKVQILFKEPNYAPDRLSFTGETQIENLNFAANIAAVLPVRLNVMGQQGIAVLENGKLEPTPIIFAPAATFTVTKTADTNDGACNADCSVREAVIAANNAAGADMITFTPNGTHQLTVGAGSENAGAGGDLDVTQSLTITGNGSANTFLQGGASVGTGIDKVISINPAFTTAFATSITSVTIRFGRNPSAYVVDGFGGGLDWEATGTGTLSITNTSVTDNRTLDGDGGGLTATNSAAGNGTFTSSGSSYSNNIPARAGANSPNGGGIFAGQTTPYLLSSVVISNNNVNGSGTQGQGGGLFAFGPSGTGGNSFMTGSIVSGNAAPSDAGGIYTTQRIDINPSTIISNNSTGRFGGGLFVNHGSATSTINKATFTGNSATTNGGAIYLGTTTTGNILNLNFSRLAGNTGGGFTGLVSAGGTANATNNWWGCNTGPSAAPCSTVGLVAGVGTVNFNPWLQFRISPLTATIVRGQSIAITATFLINSAGSSIAASNLDALIGLPVAWGGTNGTTTPTNTSIQLTGTAAASYQGTTVGAGTSTATVDSGTATSTITINKANTTSLITGQSSSTTNATRSFVVSYSVSVTSPGAGTPTGNVTISDGVNSCTGTVAAGQCTITLTTVGTRTITATYGSDASFNSSVSPGVSHVVTSPSAASVTVSGRVLTSDGRGISRATVTLTDLNGQTRSAATNSFGYYTIQGVVVGQSYLIGATHKEYVFTPQLINISEDLVDFEITAQN